MKKLLYIIAIVCTTHLVFGQITVTNATFPAAGDTLKTATDNSPEGIVITGAGGPFTWDFSLLTADTRFSTLFQPAAEGMANASYPEADLVVIIGGGAETYYDVTATVFSSLGISGSEFLSGFPLNADLKFIPPLQERQAPLTYPSVFNTSTALTIAIPLSALPAEIIDSLGIPTGFIDSIGVKLTIDRTDFVDAFGTITIPGGTYDVLREKRTDYNDTRLEVYNALLGWQDVTDLLPIGGFGRDTTISFHYLSNTEKEPIAVVTMDSTGLMPAFVDFKDNGVTSAAKDLSFALREVNVYPNPVSDFVSISFQKGTSGNFTLQIFNAEGANVLTKEVTSGYESFSMSAFEPGLYVYQLLDEHRQQVATGKIVKVLP